MGSGRPVDAIQFISINAKKIVFQQSAIEGESIAVPLESTVKIDDEPHPDYFAVLDVLVPYTIKMMGLDNSLWKHASCGGIKLKWTYNHNLEKFTYRIESIAIARTSCAGELPISRSVSFGGVIYDEIPAIVIDAIDAIMDEAWLYLSGKKTAQLNLFEAPVSKAKDEALERRRSEVRAALEQAAIPKEGIDQYLESAGETPSVDDFYDWNNGEYDDDESTLIKESIANIDEAQKSTRSKAKKVAA